MNRTTVWKIIKKFQEIGTTVDREGRGRKRTVRTREKLRRNSRRSCRNLAAAAGVGKSTMHQLLREDLGVKPFKMLRQQELSDRHVAMRAETCRKLLQDIAEGTLPNLVFTDEKKFDIQQAVNQKNDRVWASSSTTERRIVTRRQNAQSAMVWAAVTATGRSCSFLFQRE